MQTPKAGRCGLCFFKRNGARQEDVIENKQWQSHANHFWWISLVCSATWPVFQMEEVFVRALSLYCGSADRVEISFCLSHVGWSFWGNSLFGHIMSAGNIRIRFCNVVSYFSHFLYLFSGNDTFVSTGGKCAHSIMDLILMYFVGEQKNATMEKLIKQW